MMITPAAEIDDGLVDVCIVGAVPLGAVRRAASRRVFRGTHTTDRRAS